MNSKTLSLTLSAIAASISLAPIAHAAENPFAMKTVSASALVAEAGDKVRDGKCGEGKCSGRKKTESAATDSKTKEGNCGANKMKEGGCSGSMKTEETAQPKQ
ncbi:MAG: hypothetical protein PHE55_18775 [Methylococcaceae bacterium]|nr:hypothetical protein [Methylococcaceae bacterium]